MKFEDLKKEIKALEFSEVRVDSEDLFEGVILKKDLEALNARLVSFLGAPAWPSANKLSTEIKLVIDPLGGVMAGQTLYFKHAEDSSVFVMLWPWGDKDHITVKAGKR
jgi:hypothetical protein